MEQSEKAVMATAKRLVDAFSRHDRTAYFAAFAPNSTFIFHNLDRMLKSRAEYEAEWQLWERRDGFRVLGCASSDPILQMLGDTAVFAHTVTTDVALAGQTMTNRERETIVFARNKEGQWLAVHEHLSVLPET